MFYHLQKATYSCNLSFVSYTSNQTVKWDNMKEETIKSEQFSENTLDESPKKLTTGARKAMFAATLGTLIEWYDYALYGVAAGLVISPLFFPDMTGSAAALAAFATFAVGFFIRPIGGLVIAHLGDSIGRKPALILTIVLMGVATTGIGLLPTAAEIGIWAPILLVFLRAMQGFGAGAELAGALTIAAEYTPASRRGFFTGIINGVGAAGSAIAMIAFILVSNFTGEAFLEWGWRIPFLFSAVLFLLALYIRRTLDESPEYIAAKEKSEKQAESQSIPLAKLFKASPKRMVLGILLWTGHNANIYIVMTFALGYLVNIVGYVRSEALVITLTATLIGCFTSPWWGAMADRYGAKQIYAGVMIFCALFSVPLFMLMGSGNFWLALIGLSLASGITLGGTSGSAGAVTTNLFPTEYRFSGVAVSKEISAAAIAGPTPFVATALIAAADGEPWFAALYISLCCLVTLFALYAMGGNVGNRDIKSLTSI